MIETFSAALGRSVVAVDTAENVGTVKEFVVDRLAQRIDALRIAGHRKKAKFLPWSSVRSFGTDAVVAEPDSTTEQTQPADERVEKAMVGSRVLTTAGCMIGKVTDVRFETADGTIVGVDTDTGPIEAARLRSVGSYALVVLP